MASHLDVSRSLSVGRTLASQARSRMYPYCRFAHIRRASGTLHFAQQGHYFPKRTEQSEGRAVSRARQPAGCACSDPTSQQCETQIETATHATSQSSDQLRKRESSRLPRKNSSHCLRTDCPSDTPPTPPPPTSQPQAPARCPTADIEWIGAPSRGTIRRGGRMVRGW